MQLVCKECGVKFQKPSRSGAVPLTCGSEECKRERTARNQARLKEAWTPKQRAHSKAYQKSYYLTVTKPKRAAQRGDKEG